MEKKKLSIEIQEVKVGPDVCRRIGAGVEDSSSPSDKGRFSTMIGCHSSLRPPTQPSNSSFLADVASHPGNTMIGSIALGGATTAYLGTGSVPISVASGLTAVAAAYPTCHIRR